MCSSDLIRTGAKIAALARALMPRKLRIALQRHISFTDYKIRYFREQKPLASVEASDESGSDCPVRFGIVRNSSQCHTHFVAACLELGVPFRVLDLYGSDWLERTMAAECDVLLVWPDVVLSTWNSMIKDRITVLVQELGIQTVPSLSEIGRAHV